MCDSILASKWKMIKYSKIHLMHKRAHTLSEIGVWGSGFLHPHPCMDPGVGGGEAALRLSLEYVV